MGNIGLGELLMILITCAILIFPIWRITAKAGYPGSRSLVVLIPGVIIFYILFLALAEWPVERRLRGE